MQAFDESILDDIVTTIETVPPNKAMASVSMTQRRLAAQSALSRGHFNICPIHEIESDSRQESTSTLIRQFLHGQHCRDFNEMSLRERDVTWAATLWYLGLARPHLVPANQSVAYPDHLRKLDAGDANANEAGVPPRQKPHELFSPRDRHTLLLGALIVGAVICFSLGRLVGSQTPAPQAVPGPPVLTSPSSKPQAAPQSLYTPPSGQHGASLQ